MSDRRCDWRDFPSPAVTLVGSFLIIVILARVALPQANQPPSSFPPVHATAEEGAKQAHDEIWRRFIDAHGIMIDFADLDGSVSLPTPEECRLGKPNALGWWSPIENGAMFNGMYLDAILLRYQATHAQEDAEKASRLVEGLLKLNSISDVKGFVGRGVSTDGTSHYAMGSNDQTFPWFIGLACYLESGLGSQEQRERIKDHVVTTAEMLLSQNWNVPAEPPFHIRGGFQKITFESSPRLLFLCKFLARITQDEQWEICYRNALNEHDGQTRLSRLEICRRGMVFEHSKYHSWTSCSCVWALRKLWEWETDLELREAYEDGLNASAELALKNVSWASRYDNSNSAHFEMNWRVMNDLWVEQSNENESVDLAIRQIKAFGKVAPRRQLETEFVREPTSAAWIVTLSPDREFVESHRADLEDVLRHYDYSKLYYSQFFWVESAWRRLGDAPQ